ncbi:DUF4265 domain-containing protein [Stenotrophomonas sp.]|uniref:DUF4265 domain-containing protein n=1 Tax=Stenotrophomonas sp. TaxID=69392 RepID=UPI0028A2ACC9|nr:DUF4265 domain-containing protein [Stenotrophomonas sp.]
MRVHFKLEQVDDYPPAAVETVWTRPTDDGQGYIVDNIPFFITAATLDDHISVSTDDEGQRWFLENLRASANSLIRVVVFQENQLENVASALRGLGCDVEILASRCLMAVNVPSHVELGKVQDYLASEERRDLLDYEEPILRQ